MNDNGPVPITERVSPEGAEEIPDILRRAADEEQAVYPLGGETSLDFGLPGVRPGLGLSLAGLSKTIDYPARDMTVTVEAGVTLETLAETLAQENQRLPIDAPETGRATLGGLLATNFSGPRRYGQGTLRDYVIGVAAVDGHGTPFHAGGRVVKNVAGYDLCKLLIGSLGTLAVVTQVTLKVRPTPEADAFLCCDLRDLDSAERQLAALVESPIAPTAIELLTGAPWRDDPALGQANDGSPFRLLVGLEGTADEVRWMKDRLADLWRGESLRVNHVEPSENAGLWRRLTEFPAADKETVTIKANLLPGAVTKFVAELRDVDRRVSVQAHAGSGVVIARFAELAASDAIGALFRRLQPAARKAEGNVVILSAPEGAELTRSAVWGPAPDSAAVMRRVKSHFDPHGILNPGRFLYD